MRNGKWNLGVLALALLILATGSVYAQGEGEFGDAPEGVLAYPASGVIGQFPTCITVGAPGTFIQHGPLGWAWFGPSVDFEGDGNAGLCPGFNPYDLDECFMDNDAGLLFPDSFTIQANQVVPCIAGTGMPLGMVCVMANWGIDIDIDVNNTMPVVGYLNVLADWNMDGIWAPSNQSQCSAPEHVLIDFPIPIGHAGPVSMLQPPPFQIGGDIGYAWFRFSITETPVGSPWPGHGVFEDGETEDYLLQVIDDTPVETSTWGTLKSLYR